MNTEIRRYNFRTGLPLEFEMIDLELLFQKKDLISVPHRANFYHILWIQKGFANHWIDFKPLTLQENTFIFIAKDCVHYFDTENFYQGKIILFTDNFFCKNQSDINFLQSTIVFNDLFDITQIHSEVENRNFPHLFSLMENEYTHLSDTYQADLLRNYLFNFLLLAEREKLKQGHKELKSNADLEFVLSFRNLVEQHFRQQTGVSQYANQLNITEKRLYKATTQLLGKSPKEMIDERLLLEIKRLLVHTHSHIKEIAYELGFDEPTYFIKYFKKHVHQTPAEFREHYRPKSSM